jgi:hypothetical protein
VLDKHSDNIAKIYTERAGGTAEQWRDAMKEETWYTAEEGVAAGLYDKIGSGTAELPAGFDLAAFHALPGRIAARLRAMPQAAAPRAAGAAEDPAPDAIQDPAPVLAGAQGASSPACGPDCACGGQPDGHQDAKAFRSWLKKEIRGAVKKEIRAGAKARREARPKARDNSAAEDHTTAGTSGIDLEQIRAALKGAHA